MDLGLKDRVAIVTGSSMGIGKAIALGLSKEGVKTTICARNKETLIKTANEITSLSETEILPVVTDLSFEEDIENLVQVTIDKFGRIDILVNNTGGPPSKLFEETDHKDWEKAVNSLLTSSVKTCREVVPYMKGNNWGRIVNMTSFAAKQPVERLVLSNTVRAGILGLTKTLSIELAKYRILVNAVCPGWTLTDRVVELARSRSEDTGETYDSIISGWSEEIALKRLAQPKEIADLVVFLCSERSSYITGSVIQVDGGVIKSLL